MFEVVQLPESEPVRVYCSIAIAGMMLDVFYKSFSAHLWPDAPIPVNEKIKLSGNNAEDLRYLWTALMMMGPTGRSQFKKTTLEVRTQSSFNPSQELNFWGAFRSKSLRNRVFIPVLGHESIAYAADEALLPFAHQVPEGMKELRSLVVLHLCESFLFNYFTYNSASKTVVFCDATYRDTLHDLGSVKLAQAFYILSQSKKS